MGRKTIKVVVLAVVGVLFLQHPTKIHPATTKSIPSFHLDIASPPPTGTAQGIPPYHTSTRISHALLNLPPRLLHLPLRRTGRIRFTTLQLSRRGSANTHNLAMHASGNATGVLGLHYHQRGANDDGEHRLQGLRHQHQPRGERVLWTRACVL